jgi:hypothetical protein
MGITSILTPEAIATYVTGIASALVLIGIYWVVFIRKKPSRVIVEQVLDTTLLSAPKDLREAERIRILYGEEPIDMLWMTELRVRNAGNTVISDPNIYVQVDNETKMLGVQLQGVPPSPELEETCSLIRENSVTVAYPYLNPFHEHKQETTIKVLCNRKPENLTVEGGGRGWSVAFLSSAKKQQIGRRAAKIVLISIFTVFASVILAGVIATFFPSAQTVSKSLTMLAIVLIAWSLIAGPVLERWFTRSAR